MDLQVILSSGTVGTGAAAEPAGWVHVVRCEPDPFTGERLNIGVFGQDRAGRRWARFIDQPGRLECLYGTTASRVVELAAVARQAFLAGRNAPSPQLTVESAMPFFHSTLEQAIDRVFADMVTVALPNKARDTRPQRLTDEQAITRVTDALKKRLKLEIDFLANTPDVIVESPRGPLTLKVPLQPPEGVGTIRSADYAADTLRAHLMESVIDLRCAAQYRSKRGIGLFVLRPPATARSDAREVDTVIDSVYARMERDVQFEVEQDAQTLAQVIADWSRSLRS